MNARAGSLSFRLLFITSISLAVFLLLAAFGLDRAFRQSIETSIETRLRSHVFSLLAAAELREGNFWLDASALPDPAFGRPASGLYAAVRGDDMLWQSPSSESFSIRWSDDLLQPGASRFEGPLDTAAGMLYVLSLGVLWEEDGEERPYSFFVAEDLAAFRSQLSEFRRQLWLYLLLGVVLLLSVQALVLRIGLRPLRRLENQLRGVEVGLHEQLIGSYPRELQGVVSNLNAFIRSERRNLARYRDRLADLAHSLKTPLAVIRTLLSDSTVDSEALDRQTRRMEEIVTHQLGRARAATTPTLAPMTALAPLVVELMESLQKIYAQRELSWRIEVADEVRVAMERGDLLEVAGNLLDNAAKWAKSTVVFRALDSDVATTLIVEDDGPGIADDQIAEVLQRGTRADEQVPGHGIGLGMVAELIRGYEGSLQIGSSELGGARVQIDIYRRQEQG